MEHHANIVPWQMLCARVGAELRVIPLNPDGTLQLETLPTLFDEKTRLLAITHVSNVLGTENPLAEMITLAHQHGAKVLVDGAQAVMHHRWMFRRWIATFTCSPGINCMAPPELAFFM